MKRTILYLRSKNQALLYSGFFVFILFGILAFNYRSALNQDRTLNTLNQGMHTCFTRVSQSFTAFMIGNQFSPYLKEGFANLTSECFAQINEVFTEGSATVALGFQDKFNELSNNVHWFSQNLLKSRAANMIEAGDKKFINRKFTKIENDINALYDGIAKSQSEIASSIKTLEVGLLFLFFIASFIFVAFLIERSSMLKAINKLEKEAQNFKNKKEFNVQNAQKLWNQVASLHRLNSISSFFTAFFDDLKDASVFEKEKRSVVAATESDVKSKESDPYTTEVINDDNFQWKENGQYKITCLNTMIFDIVDKLSQQAMAKGIVINFTNEEDVYVWSKPEALHQVVYSLFLKSFDACMIRDDHRGLQINLKSVGELVWLDFSIDGHCFNSSELDYMNGNFPQKMKVDTNLMLAKELTSDINGDLSLSNKIADNARSMKAQFKITLKRADYQETMVKPSKAQVRSVIKGSKKEVAERLRELQL